jgi:hypothetical protein
MGLEDTERLTACGLDRASGSNTNHINTYSAFLPSSLRPRETAAQNKTHTSFSATQYKHHGENRLSMGNKYIAETI